MNCDFSSCTARPATAAGAAYLRVAIDPCGENLPVDFKGIPDGSEVDIVLLRLRDDLVLTSPSDLSPEGTWGLMIYDTPYLLAQQILIRYDDAVGPPTQVQVRQYLNGLDQSEANGPTLYPSWYRPVRYLEEFIQPNGVGRLAFRYEKAPFEVSVLKPAVFGSFNFSADAPGWRTIRKFRFVSKGRTLHLNAPATATQGRMVSGQVGTESSAKIITIDPDAMEFPIQDVLPARFTVSPPADFNILPQQDLNCRQDIIKTGSYDMQRHWNGSHMWNEVEDVRPIFRADSGNLTANFHMASQYQDAQGGTSFSNQTLKYDGFDVSLGWTVTHIDGMSSVASVHMKHRSYWEVNVPGDSPWAANKQAPCPHDAGALSLEKQIAPCIPHSFEAKFNDAGLLGMLIRGVTSVGKSLLGGAVSGAMQSLSNRAGAYGRKVVIDDPYSGRSIYGESGFVGPKRKNGKNGNGNGNGQRR
nr:MAG: peptidase A21 family protein [Crogonang virus 37]